MMRLLLDENISPALVQLLADADVYAQSVDFSWQFLFGDYPEPSQIFQRYLLHRVFDFLRHWARQLMGMQGNSMHRNA